MTVRTGETLDPKTGLIMAVYDDERIFSGIEAYEAMIQWMDLYFKDKMDYKVGEAIGLTDFGQGDFVDREDCWEAWERVVKEALDKRK